METLPLREAREAVCRPRPDSRHCEEVLAELEKLGVEAYVPLGGFTLSRGLRLLGAGWAGNVFAAIYDGEIVAVKVLRPDSRRRTILRECLLASLAAGLGVAPRVYRCGLRAMIMRLVRGVRLSSYKPPGRVEALLVVRLLLFRAYLLDRVGIDHGELVRPGGQVLVENHDPFIIDYDSASVLRRPRNVTRLAAGLWRVEHLRPYIKPSSEEGVRRALRAYRSNPTLETLEEVIRALTG